MTGPTLFDETSNDHERFEAEQLARNHDAARQTADLTDEAGELRPSVRVLIDGESASLTDQLPPDASMTLFPAMRGG